MEIKFAHTSDLHIGAKCRGIGAKGEIRRHEILNTFFNIMRMCTENNIDILFIAGDLFDDVRAASEQDIKSLKRALSKGNFKVVISPGNHDPLIHLIIRFGPIMCGYSKMTNWSLLNFPI